MVMLQRKQQLTAVLCLLIASSWLAGWIKPAAAGLDPVVIGGLFVVAEALYLAGLGVMLATGSRQQLSWSGLRSFRLDPARLDWHHPGVRIGLWLNRLAWTLPFLYLIALGWRELPWWVTAGSVMEIGMTLWVGVAVTRMARPTRPRVVIRAATPDDLAGILQVDQAVWGDILPGNEAMFRSRIETFPEGGLVVAEVDGRIVAFVSTQLIESPRFSDRLTWDQVTDRGTIQRTHVPGGAWLYGVGLAATPEATRHRAVTPLLLFIARLAIAQQKRGIALAARIPGYHRYAQRMVPEAYVLARQKGRPLDPELRLYHSYGLVVGDPPTVITDYMGVGADPESGDYSVLVFWRNPCFGRPGAWLWSRLFQVR
jgi:hypothetical protein